jgi:uncharacterized protein (TIGR02145 family)
MKQSNQVVFSTLILALFFSFVSNITISQVTDKDGNVYKTVIIGTQEWMVENLNVEHYRNGDPIPQVQDADEWAGLKTGGWCYYENKLSNGKTYGKMYNWYAVTDPRGFTPEGCHIPSEVEWKQLLDFLGGAKVAGAKLKATTLWTSIKQNDEVTNESGFTALPSGKRFKKGSFDNLGKWACFWSSTEVDSGNAISRYLSYGDFIVYRFEDSKSFGFSVRCVKD